MDLNEIILLTNCMVNKIPRDLDNPFDNLFNDLAEWVSESFYATGHTPNMITTYSLIFGLLSIYFLSKNNVLLFFVCWITSYFFDCFDGYFARKYSMTSQFGDYYDHIKDTFVSVLLYYYVYTHFKITTLDIYVLIIATVLMHIHLGCQQIYTRKDDNTEYLDKFQGMCPDISFLEWSRYFGPGTINVLLPCYIIYIIQRKV